MKKLTNEEFNEWKVLALFMSTYKSKMEFEEVAHAALIYAADIYKNVLDVIECNELVKLKSNLDLIKVLFSLTNKTINGSKEAKTFANDIIDLIDINEIPTSAKICVLLELDPRIDNYIPKRNKIVLKALQEDSNFRQTVDIYNLDFEEIGVYDWKRNIDSLDYIEGKDRALKINGYHERDKCAVFVNYNIQTKNIINHTLNENYSKIKNLIIENEIELLAN